MTRQIMLSANTEVRSDVVSVCFSTADLRNQHIAKSCTGKIHFNIVFMICLLVFYVGLTVLYFLTISEVAVGFLDTNCSLLSKSVYED